MPLIYNLSDDVAILRSTEGTVNNKIKKSFKFENWWLKENDFQDHANFFWNASRNKSFSNRTNHLAGALKVW
jgi:hypothetical protein